VGNTMQSCNTCPHCHHLRGGDNQRALHQRCGYERIHKNDHLECPAKARLVAQEPPTFGSAWKSHATPLLMSMHAPMDGEMRAPSPAMHAGCALMRSSRARTKCPRQILGRSAANVCALCRVQHKQHSGRWCSTESTARIVAAERATDRTDRFDPVLLTDRCVA